MNHLLRRREGWKKNEIRKLIGIGVDGFMNACKSQIVQSVEGLGDKHASQHRFRFKHSSTRNRVAMRSCSGLLCLGRPAYLAKSGVGVTFLNCDSVENRAATPNSLPVMRLCSGLSGRFSATTGSRVKFPAPEQHGLARNDGSQACLLRYRKKRAANVAPHRTQEAGCFTGTLESCGLKPQESRPIESKKQLLKDSMNKEQYASYLQSDHWKKLRRLKLESCGYKCNKCGSKFYLQVHHEQYRNIYNVTLKDLVVLCRYCHEKAHGIVSGFRPIKPDVRSLLKGQFNVPVKPTNVIKKPINSMTQEQIRATIKRNKQKNGEVNGILRGKAAWDRVPEISGRY